MEDRLDRSDILRRLSLEHQRLMDTFARLTAEQWSAAGAVGTWTAKDVLAHLVYWNHYATDELRAAVSGTWFVHPFGTTDEINAQAIASFQGWAVEAIQDAFEHSYAELTVLVESLPVHAFEVGNPIEQALDETVHGALANNTYEHWPIHEAQIREWIDHVEK
ncbi:MAG: ClbS/DfsB family four-helix bundle protein [Anaerolineaceae bacterium]|nr:ClbS/DfsB family four-helix bundle protein [Anaerolineaceae bacterium]